jgi:hypothetical protein
MACFRVLTGAGTCLFSEAASTAAVDRALMAPLAGHCCALPISRPSRPALSLSADSLPTCLSRSRHSTARIPGATLSTARSLVGWPAWLPLVQVRADRPGSTPYLEDTTCVTVTGPEVGRFPRRDPVSSACCGMVATAHGFRCRFAGLSEHQGQPSSWSSWWQGALRPVSVSNLTSQ